MVGDPYPHEQCSKPLLVADHEVLYYQIFWGLSDYHNPKGDPILWKINSYSCRCWEIPAPVGRFMFIPCLSKGLSHVYPRDYPMFIPYNRHDFPCFMTESQWGALDWQLGWFADPVYKGAAANLARRSRSECASSRLGFLGLVFAWGDVGLFEYIYIYIDR